MRCSLAVAFLVLLLINLGACNPLFKVFCDGTPVYRGRLDSIVAPGGVSAHVHRVAGGSNFGPATAAQTPVQVYNDMRASPCTTCSIKTVDLSAYWHPELYYQWPNKSLSLVPKGGLTVYYLFRNGDGAQATPAWQAFPPGFRMVSGNPFRRSYNSSAVAEQAVSFACLSNPGGPEMPGLDIVKTRFCVNGLRMQVHFPQCWDGKNLDSPTHNTHVAFPIERPDGGNCPATHPVRLPNLFFEAFYSVDQFPHGTGTQPFILAPGDATGYGFHGDFLNGWDQNVLQAAINDASCDQSNTNNGNTVTNCKPLAQYVQSTTAGACEMARDIGINEFLGVGSTISALPGNNTITYGPAMADIYPAGPTSMTPKAPVSVRFHLKSVLNGKYVTARGISKTPLAATSTLTTYHETFTTQVYGSYVALICETLFKYVTAGGDGSRLIPDRDGASDWEQFQMVAQANNNWAIISKRNGQYVTVQSDNTLAPVSTTIGNAQLFQIIQPSGGGI